ncbi:serine/threonine-protein kinase par-4-like [Oppia nitens]|uniref:serine/threonine-protein kinase par-4-like n=1 Tax=Oppia nitens TaxID=1686743 RepID=UPI0023DC563C|nr:serine/threonine-protein kinase par-4-like [Oppia nitens]
MASMLPKMTSTVTQKVQSVAIKAIDVRKYHKILSQINNIDNNDELATVFNNSLNILKKISHQRIVKIEKILETFVKNNEISRLFVVSEMAETNLNDFILHQKPNGLDDEDWARVWFRHICEAVDCLHNTYQVSHQNIKPENILLFTKTQMSENKIPYDIKLGDCGISMLFPNLSNVCTGRDTISVMSSPDTQFKNVMSSDIYSLAIVLVILLNGDSKKYLMTSRQLGVFAYFNDKTFADDIKDQSIKGLIEKMMSRYYDSRPNIRDVLQYEWLKLKN